LCKAQDTFNPNDVLNELEQFESEADFTYLDFTSIGNICKTTPADDAFINAVNDIRDVIRRLDGPLTELMSKTDFQAFTVVDSMKIFEAFLTKFDKKWCNKFVAVIQSVDEETTMTPNKVADIARDIVGTIMNILDSLGVNPQIGRLVAMANLGKAFVLRQEEFAKELFGEESWQYVELIISAIDFTGGSAYSASPAVYDDMCDSAMGEVIEVIDLAKPLVVGLINDFNNAFRGKEGLLSYGKMVFFEYRLTKHFLLDQNACEKLINGAAGIIENLDLETASSTIENAFSSISGTTARAASGDSTMKTMMNLFGDFAESETPPAGEKKLTYEIYKMAHIGETAIQAAPQMIKTIKTKAGPILEKAGMPDMKTMLDGIKEEDVETFATEMSAEMKTASNEMVCNGKSTCDELTNFKSEVTKEIDAASGLPGNGSGKTVLSFSAFLITILSVILA